jgi:hypothetical protein
MTVGNGRSNRWKREKLSEHLAEGGVSFAAHDLDEALIGLEDCGQIVRVKSSRSRSLPPES